MSIIDKWKSWAPYFLSLLRIIAGAMFLCHGTAKIFGWPEPPHDPFVLMSQGGIGGVLEAAGGALMLLGLCTRPIAFVLSGMMAVAYFQFHAPGGFFPTVNKGELAVLYCFVWLYFSAAGPGPLSLDALLRKEKST